MNKLQKKQMRQKKGSAYMDHGVWDREMEKLIKDEYFRRNTGEIFTDYVAKNKGPHNGIYVTQGPVTFTNRITACRPG